MLGAYGVTDLLTRNFIVGDTTLPGTETPTDAGAITGNPGCCIDATQNTVAGFLYSAYITDENTCATRQGNDELSGVRGVYWQWYGHTRDNLNTCGEIRNTCYDVSFIGESIDRQACATRILPES